MENSGRKNRCILKTGQETYHSFSVLKAGIKKEEM